MDTKPQTPNTIEPTESPSTEGVKTSRKSVYWIIGGILIVALLAGGAFMAMRLLNQKPQQGLGGGDGGMSLRTSGGPGGAQSVRINIIPSKELPQAKADLRGMVVKAENNSLFVGEMQQMMVMASKNGSVSTSPTPTGPYTEVVISQDTKVYKDVTMDSMPDPSTASNGTAEVQQQLAAGSVSDVVAGNTSVQVWGQKRGDRLIADVVVLQGIGVVKGGAPSK